jgi:hypothetical protein
VTRAAAATVAFAAFAALAGCVVQDPPRTAMCFRDGECDPGEVCGDDHICYGNPPATVFLAELTPPLGRTDLAPTELPFEVTSQGDFVAAFAPSIAVSGRVVLASDPATTVAAHLVFRRPSRIKGAPDYVVSGDSSAGVADPTAPSFATRLVPVLPGESYSVTIYPDDTRDPDGPEAETLAQKAPPYRQIGFAFDGDATDLVFPLAAATKKITGRVVDSTLAHPQANLDVRAYGRFGPLDPVEVASSRGVTAAAGGGQSQNAPGSFTIYVPSAWEDDFEVRITPRADNPQPTIVLKHVRLPDGQAELALGDIALPAFPAATTYQVPVQGEAPEGGLEPAVGARISLRTVLFEDDARVVFYQAQGAADDHGLAQVPLIPAAAGENRIYRYDVAPVANTPHRSIWGEMLAVGPAGGVLAQGATLGARVLLSGQLRDSLGIALPDVGVQVQPSVRFTYELLAATTPFDVSTVAFPSTTTSKDGRFSIWVDPEVVSVQAGYVLEFVPPADSLQPLWTSSGETRVAPDPSGGQGLGDIWLPDPAYVRGTVATSGRDPVPGAEIRLYEAGDDATACAEAQIKCVAPAILRAQGTTNDQGGVRLVLPRP